MPDLAAGTVILAQDTPVAVGDSQVDEFSFTNTSLGVTTTGGTYVTCGAAFMAPTSGRGIILLAAEVYHSTSGTAQVVCAPVVRDGGTVGSGTTFLNGDPEGALYQIGVDRQRVSMFLFVSGMTAGATYNVRLEHRVGPSGTGNMRRRTVAFIPTS